MSYEYEYRWSFLANVNRSLRQRFGALLRKAASLVDGRISVALEISTIPPISLAERNACVEHGLRQMSRAVEESAKCAGIEHVLGYVMKELHGTPT